MADSEIGLVAGPFSQRSIDYGVPMSDFPPSAPPPGQFPSGQFPSGQFPPGQSPGGSPVGTPPANKVQADKAPRTVLIVGIVLLLFSLGGCGFGAFKMVSAVTEIARALDSAQTQPSGSVVELTNAEGKALIFGTRHDLVCEVIDQDGRTVRSSATSPEATIERNNAETQFFLQGFDADPSFTYQVSCGNPDLTGEFSVVTIAGFGSLAGGLAGFVSGGLLFLLGGIFFIVGLIQRGKWKRNQREIALSSSYGGGAPQQSTWNAPPSPSMPPAPGQATAPVPPAPSGFPPPSGQSAPPPPMPPASPSPQPPPYGGTVPNEPQDQGPIPPVSPGQFEPPSPPGQG